MPAERISTARFMGWWVGTLLPLALLQGLVSHWVIARELASRHPSTGLHLLMPVLCGIVAGAIQTRLLARFRSPLPRWTLATALGVLAGLLLTSSLSAQTVALRGGPASSFSWLIPAVWASTSALCLATAQGFAIWGRRWSPLWPLWICGMLAVKVVTSLGVSALWRELLGAGGTLPIVPWVGVGLLQAAVVGAGAAWLLDRLAFRDPPPEAAAP